jgi:hypothetical protein
MEFNAYELKTFLLILSNFERQVLMTLDGSTMFLFNEGMDRLRSTFGSDDERIISASITGIGSVTPASITFLADIYHLQALLRKTTKLSVVKLELDTNNYPKLKITEKNAAKESISYLGIHYPTKNSLSSSQREAAAHGPGPTLILPNSNIAPDYIALKAVEYENIIKELKDVDSHVKINMQREKITFSSKIEQVCEKTVCLSNIITPHYFFERTYDIDHLSKVLKLSTICNEVMIAFNDTSIQYAFHNDSINANLTLNI